MKRSGMYGIYFGEAPMKEQEKDWSKQFEEVSNFVINETERVGLNFPTSEESESENVIKAIGQLLDHYELMER